jgi:phosphatidylinositol alpha-1,6-mannosyltransferase
MDVLIDAAGRLAGSHPALAVVIAGAGRDTARLKRRVAAARAPVRLLGRISEDEKIALVGAADIFAMVCRSRWGGLEQEGFGIVFLEAAAAGVAQVAGESGGAAEAVEDGETGIVVRRPRDVGDVAAALRRLIDDPALRDRMGAAARARAEACFDYGVLAPRLAQALAEVEG